MSDLIEGRTGPWEIVIGLEVHAQVTAQGKTVFRRRDRFRGRAEHAGLDGRCRVSRHAAGDQPALRRAGGQDRARARRRDQFVQRVRPQELFLSGPPCRLSDLAVSAAGRRAWPGRARHAGRLGARDRHHPRPSRTGCRQEPARPAPDADLCRFEPRRHRADGDRLRTRSAERRGGRALSPQTALDPALSRHLRRQHGGGFSALRLQRVGAAPGRPLRHALRDQERELGTFCHAGDRVRGAAPDRADRGGRHGRAADAAVRQRPGRDKADALEGTRA